MTQFLLKWVREMFLRVLFPPPGYTWMSEVCVISGEVESWHAGLFSKLSWSGPLPELVTSQEWFVHTLGILETTFSNTHSCFATLTCSGAPFSLADWPPAPLSLTRYILWQMTVSANWALVYGGWLHCPLGKLVWQSFMPRDTPEFLDSYHIIQELRETLRA